MSQIMAIDYGKKRTGIAVTDDMQIIASGLDTVETIHLLPFLKTYFLENKVETVVIGLPVDLRGNMSTLETHILEFIKTFIAAFPEVSVERMDERYTSKIASYYISQSGKNKKQRQDKGMIDKVSATLLLQNYLELKRK